MNILIGSILFLFILTSCADNADKNVVTSSGNASVQNTTTTIPATSTSNLSVPKFKDPQIQAYFNWHSKYVTSYLEAVRQNNKPAIKAVFENGASKADEAIAIMEKARMDAEDYRKVQEYTRQTVPIMREVAKSAYVQDLTNEYMKKQK
jgi:hypothetical protein